MTTVPRPILTVHGEDVYLTIPRLLTIRASFLSEGLFDEAAGGAPDEEDLYEIEVTHEGGALLEPITFPRLSPATPDSLEDWLEDDEDAPIEALPIERFVLVLAWDLANAHSSNWDSICQAARGWDAWTLEDAAYRIPPEWTPQDLLPDDD